MKSGATTRYESHKEPETGLVVAAYGRHVLVEDETRDRHRCILAKRRLRAVCGDVVQWSRALDDSDGIVLKLSPRTTELARPSRRGDREILAANIEQVVVVSAPRPDPDPFLIDRYLAASELMGTEGCLVYNKSDLDPEHKALDLSEFSAVGYPVVTTSVLSGAGLEDLRKLLVDRISIFVGHSGVGKSSLLNRLIPDAEIETAALSSASGEGRHTTTASVLHRLSIGGAVIDSPGVRDYAPSTIAPRDVSKGFREIGDRSDACRFSNCMHLREPGCAVKEAVETGEISARRYESYRRLVRLMEQLGPSTT
ncbi:MAG: ribosome small subunit-dependent GTPase A [Gammaproteobacteria bacterium]|nr:MAG: ribosome small subunit-dependent GTPase A [Gammaproteobacteria bacterium]